MSKILGKTLSNAMKLQEKRLALTANNLANATTTGYKEMQMSFEVLKPTTTENPVMTSMVPYINFSKANLVQTESVLDVAINGNGFFVISMPEGMYYTRNGRFTLDTEKRLVTPSGHLVMGYNGTVTIEGSNITIKEDGAVYADDQAMGRLKIVDFNEKKLLQPIGSSLFKYTGKDGEMALAKEYTVKQGFLEASNVDMIREMVNLINTQRTFESYDKAKKMAGETSKSLINLIAK